MTKEKIAINELEMMRNYWTLGSKHNRIDIWVQKTATAVKQAKSKGNG